jgi:hypothetical protein
LLPTPGNLFFLKKDSKQICSKCTTIYVPTYLHTHNHHTTQEPQNERRLYMYVLLQYVCTCIRTLLFQGKKRKTKVSGKNKTDRKHNFQSARSLLTECTWGCDFCNDSFCHNNLS